MEVTCQETWPRMSYYDSIKASCSTSVWPKTAYYTLVSGSHMQADSRICVVFQRAILNPV